MEQRDSWIELTNEKVVSIDIDDTICDSTPFWIEFVNDKLGTDFDNLGTLKATLPYNEYKKIKKEFRTSGIKLDIPMIEGASDLTRKLKELGYKIIIITARPANEYPELTKITNQWLRDNDIKYDGIIFDKHKSIKVLEQVPNLEFSVNDHYTEALLLAKWGYTTFLVDNKYNRRDHDNPYTGKIIRVKELTEIIKYIEKDTNDRNNS